MSYLENLWGATVEGPPEVPPEQRTYAQRLEAVASEAYSAIQLDVPIGYLNWDWMGLFRAFAEGQQTVNSIHMIRPSLPDDLMYGVTPAHLVRDDRRAGSRVLPKMPGTGAWDYVWYIPEWSHPQFDPDIEVTYVGAPVARRSRDPIYKLRPALRTADLVRRPTEWALRFGIHPDELSGRSRLSPTFAPSRDPLQDYANQINMLDDETRARAIEASRGVAWRVGGANGNDIAPTVLDEILTAKGALTGQQLRETLANGLVEGGAGVAGVPGLLNLEQIINIFSQQMPNVLPAHRNLLENALIDQDYQRILFQDLTSDELSQLNVQTMSNTVFCDLQGEIHPLIRRDRWAAPPWKGSYRYAPRFVYNLNGEREEWDASTNDALWTAMQPALQLVTRVLNSGPPGLHALMDMRTRLPLPAEKDAREEPETPSIPTYRNIEEMDMDKTFPQIRRLHELGFDWIGKTYMILHTALYFDIGTVHLEPMQSDNPAAVDGVMELKNMAYGFSKYAMGGLGTEITINVGAELLWPLLAPQLSQSEKLMTSFGVASTILHEIAHAVNFAHQSLTTDNYYIYSRDHSAEVSAMLLSLADELWDSKNTPCEPFYKDFGTAESGFDFEFSLWGVVATNMLGHFLINDARHLKSLPWLLMGSPWPLARHPVAPSKARREPIKGANYAVEEYATPIPIHYAAKFFTQKFWDTDFQKYGHEALKLIPEGRMVKTVMVPHWMGGTEVFGEFGRDDWWFLQFMITHLHANQYVILSEFIKRSLWEVMTPVFHQRRWEWEVHHWEDARLSPLESALVDLVALFAEVFSFHQVMNLSPAEKQVRYTVYLEEYQRGTIEGGQKSFEMWLADIQHHWDGCLKDGGRLMRALSLTYRYMMADIAHLQRMIFDFFSLNPAARNGIYTGLGSASEGPIGAAYGRMQSITSQIGPIAGELDRVCQAPLLAPIKDKWTAWAARYRRCYSSYNDLLGMLGNPGALDPNDISWKSRFQALPSSYWKNRMDRLRTLANREYAKLDHRLRPFVDECEGIIRRHDAAAHFARPIGQNVTVGHLQYKMGAVNSLGQPLPSTARPNFQWARPSQQQQPVAYDNVWQSSSAQYQPPPAPPPAPPPGERTGGVVFGQPAPFNPAHVLGAPPPRRGSNSGSGSAEFTQWANGGTGFVESANAAGASKQFGYGGPMVPEPHDATVYNQRRRSDLARVPTMFPNAYSGMATLTPDVISYEMSVQVQDIDAKTGAGNAPYKTSQPYRETRPLSAGSSSDDPYDGIQ
ncbi:hypothetical protein F4677DRAFT_228627 [Hypoxylon crocopeplum]|nr:hypothetical protein F4677DRAFT_228627 [Hypoxylon crocopeplum]